MAVCVLDTETTGIPSAVNNVSMIELGAVMLTDEGEEIASFGCFVRPLYPVGHWCKRAMEVNQIDPSLLLSAPAPEEVWDAFISWLGLNAPVKGVYAFNVSFDRRAMIKSMPSAVHLPWASCLMRDANNVLFDSKKSIKLETAARAFGISVPKERHRALADARLAGRVYQEMCQNQRYEGRV